MFKNWIGISIIFSIFLVTIVVAEIPFSRAQGLSDARRAELERELAQIEQEIREQRVVLQDKQKERTSLERDVAILDAKINESRLQIRATDLKIQSLTRDIGLKNLTIGELEAKMNREKDSLAQILRRRNEIDSFSLAEVILGNKNLSEFFEDVDSFSSIKESMQVSFREIEETKDQTQNEKVSLENTRSDVQDLRGLQIAQRRQLERQEAEKEELLRITRGEEARYQEIIAEKQRTAAQIRAELFPLLQSEPIPFGLALDYANQASSKTGVRPALILAILKQESDLGANVGTCNRPQDPPEKKYDQIMPGPLHYANYVSNGNSCVGAASPCSWRDDQTILKEITTELGLDFNTVPLSCPIASVGGWGGAMGPSQFIPSTWKSYQEELAQTLGVSTPSPWNPQHAIMATALLMEDNGASVGGFNAERLAALRYFAGWSNATNPRYAFYGNSVMELVSKIQADIDVLENN